MRSHIDWYFLPPIAVNVSMINHTNWDCFDISQMRLRQLEGDDNHASIHNIHTPFSSISSSTINGEENCISYTGVLTTLHGRWNDLKKSKRRHKESSFWNRVLVGIKVFKQIVKRKTSITLTRRRVTDAWHTTLEEGIK